MAPDPATPPILTPDQRTRDRRKATTLMTVGVVLVLASLATLVLSSGPVRWISAGVFFLSWIIWFWGKTILKFRVHQ